MAQVHTGDLPPGTKRRLVCAEPINEKASKCIHCQSDQGGIRRRLGVSTTVLSLLVALVTVLTFAIPVIRDALTSRDSRLIASMQGMSDDRVIAVLVSNTGARPGTVGWANISAIGQAFSLSVQGDVPIVVEPGKSVLVRFKNTSPAPDLPEFRNLIQMPDNFECKFVLGLTSFTGEVTTIELPISCGQVAAFYGLL